MDHQHKENRLQQVETVNKFLFNEKRNLPVILAGDLNFEPESDEYRKMQKRWTDTAIYGKDKRNYTYPTEDPRKRIDYVFTTPSQKWEVISHRTPKLPYSDHLPVVTQLVLHE